MNLKAAKPSELITFFDQSFFKNLLQINTILLVFKYGYYSVLGALPGGFMKKVIVIFVVSLFVCSSLLQAHLSKLQLKYDSVGKDTPPCPPHLMPYLDHYLTVNANGEVAFTSGQDACYFKIEYVVKTMMGTTYHRVTYQDNFVLVWDDVLQQLKLVPKDEKITQLRDQIQWHIFLNWFDCRKTMTPLAHRSGISLRFE